MIRSRVLAIVAVGCVLVGLGIATALPKDKKGGAKPPVPSPQKIALLDINKIFKNHAGLQAMKEAMEQDVKRAEEEVKEEKERIKALQEQQAKAGPGTEEYRKLQKEIEKHLAVLNAHVQVQRQDFLRQEADIYSKVHQELLGEVRRYAKAKGITTIFKFDSEVANPDVPETVVRSINNPVVYCEDGLDITEIILQRVNKKGQ